MKNYGSLLSLKVLYVQILKNEIKIGLRKGTRGIFNGGKRVEQVVLVMIYE